MKTIDIIMPGPINSIIGPVGTLKRMLKYQDYFHSRGYDVTVFTDESLSIGPIKEPPVAKYAKPTYKTYLRKKIGSIIAKHARNCYPLTCFLMNRRRKKVERLVDYYLSLDRNPDIIEFHSNLECSIYLKKNPTSNAKSVLFLHSDGIPFRMLEEYYPKLNGSKYLRKMEDEFSATERNTNMIVFIAKIGRTNFLKLYPHRNEESTFIILNGIDDLTNSQKDEISRIKEEMKDNKFKYRLCCTGSINARKGQRIIIEALHKLSERDLQNIHVDFIGDGAERIPIEGLVKCYGLENNVTFLGMIPNAEVYKYLAKNNIFILMSYNEGLPISIIEAMRASMAIVSTNVSGIPELISNNGKLLNPDYEELTHLLSSLELTDWDQLGKNSRKRFEEEFTFERMRAEFCDMYDKVLE